jgi:hypothetical protein
MRRFFSEREGVGNQLPRLGGSSGLSRKASNPSKPTSFGEVHQAALAVEVGREVVVDRLEGRAGLSGLASLESLVGAFGG